jgi:hypothetical protein
VASPTGHVFQIARNNVQRDHPCDEDPALPGLITHAEPLKKGA